MTDDDFFWGEGKRKMGNWMGLGVGLEREGEERDEDTTVENL